MKLLSQADLHSEICNFSGTENWYKHSLTGFLYTDGVKHCAETFGMYWFLDIVFLKNKPRLLDEFQVWTLSKNLENNSCTIVADNGDEDDDGIKKILYTQNIPYTDFPYQQIQFFFTGNVLLLPNEY